MHMVVVNWYSQLRRNVDPGLKSYNLALAGDVEGLTGKSVGAASIFHLYVKTQYDDASSLIQ
jgi:hypothetical protein